MNKKVLILAVGLTMLLLGCEAYDELGKSRSTDMGGSVNGGEVVWVPVNCSDYLPHSFGIEPFMAVDTYFSTSNVPYRNSYSLDGNAHDSVFGCRKGKEMGENENWFYCRTVNLMRRFRDVTEDGMILSDYTHRVTVDFILKPVADGFVMEVEPIKCRKRRSEKLQTP